MPTPVLTPRSLYEDWQLRRQRLDKMPNPIGKTYVALQARVLDYLLRRYEGADEAKKFARFPLASDVLFNHRAVIVHHHLEKGKFAAVKSEAESRSRMSSILQRIKTTDPQADAKAPIGGALFGSNDPIMPPTINPILNSEQRAHVNIASALRWGIDAYPAIERAVELNPTLPDSTVEWLFTRIENDAADKRQALEILLRCNNSSALDYILMAWKTACTRHSNDDFTRALERMFAIQSRREHAAERLRGELANRSQNVRLRAADLLSTLGTLDDIGLLMDLLSMPRTGLEDAVERDAYAAAIKTLSGTPEA